MQGFVSLRAFYQEDNKVFRFTSINLGKIGTLAADETLDAATLHRIADNAMSSWRRS
jgi:hypothetical protein